MILTSLMLLRISQDKKIKGEAAARVFVEQFLKIKGVKQDCPGLKEFGDVRRELIAELRERSNLSIGQIASILGIGRGMVQRVKA